MEGPEALPYSAAVTITTVMLSVVFISISSLFLSKRKVAPRDPKLPPQCKVSLGDHMNQFSGPFGPEYLLKLARDMGCADFESPTSIIPFFPRLFILTDHRSARKALEDVGSTKPALTNLFFVRTTHNGPNVITSEGHRWKHVKKSTSTAFNTANLKKMIDPIDAILEKWIKLVLEPCMKSQTPINILDEMNKITANIIVDVAFDYQFESGEMETFLHDLSICWKEFGVEGNKNPFSSLPVIEHLFPGILRGRRAAKRMYDFCGKLLQAYKEKNIRREHKLIDMILYDKEYADDGERCRDMMAYVIAGFDTTANTIAFALRALAMDQNEQTKLRNELRSHQSPDDARNCKQLKMTIKETLRMYPAAALGSVRRLGKDLMLPWSKKVIPEGSWVLAQYYSIQRDPSLFDNPSTFSPDRWENATTEQTKSLMTFSVGRRSCQGLGLANLELNELLCKLVSKYRFDIVERGEPQCIVLFKPVGTLLSVSLAD